jgi:hypothetical protein
MPNIAAPNTSPNTITPIKNVAHPIRFIQISEIFTTEHTKAVDEILITLCALC